MASTKFRLVDPLRFTLAVLPPPGSRGLQLLRAVGQVGELPVFDTAGRPGPAELADQLAQLRRAVGNRFGLRLEVASLDHIQPLLAEQEPLDLLLLSGDASDLAPMVTALRPHARRLFREVINQAEAEQALAAGVDGLVAKGNESGGRVGTETSLVLLQRLCPMSPVPVWAQGGISPHAVAACLAAGADGVVLDNQLALTDEADLPDVLRSLLTAMDGSETICLGEALGRGFRTHRMRGTACIKALQEVETNTADPDAFAQRLDELRAAPVGDALWPVGQEAALAARLSQRHGSVAGILRAYRRQAVESLRTLAQTVSLAEDGPFARAHGIRYPIFQGPMTRVSDVAPFADAVSRGGGLPFLALALLREPDCERLLQETAALLGDRPWGVGILGFVPAELRAEQLRAVHRVKPRFALLAGGRPDQARELDAAGIITYLHTPSARLLEMFLREGSRRFIFEGRECGGHVGPLSSFMLWDTVLDVLLDFRRRHPNETLDVVFAGGIHDGTSAAMASALAAPLTAAGVRCGVLMGTAYLFTHEAVATGAVVPTFQEKALACRDTVLLDMHGGHAIRCIPTAYADEFQQQKRSLLRGGAAPEDVRRRLEEENIGRLRIASKGMRRTVPLTAGPREEMGRENHLVPVDIEEQKRDGMYMIGSVAALHRGLSSIEELHRDVCQGAADRLRELTAGLPDPAAALRPEPEAPLAIIGMACLLPGATDMPQFWSNILHQRNAIREVPAERWDARLFYHPDPQTPDRVISKWGGFLDPVPFDPVPFGIPPASLRAVEPMHLLVLEVARRALADAGYDRHWFARERTGVIFGIGGGGGDLGMAFQGRTVAEHFFHQTPGLDPAEWQETLRKMRAAMPPVTEDSFPGTLNNVVAGRVANRFDLGGPNYAIDAACASSLAALEASAKELRLGTSDLVLVGGGDAQQHIGSYLMFSKTYALSPRGRCRPFDAHADGIAISEGLALVLTKRLDEALRDGDRVYAVIRSVASASDGRDKSLTAPSLIGQRRTLERAYGDTGVSPATVGLVEAHGTGTVVGDRTELQALSEVFRDAGAPAQGAALGSVKSQIGHTKSGAGLAGLIKVALALHHRTLPPTLVEEPSPAVRDRSLPFYLNTRARPWFHRGPEPRRAAVSAFGFGGTNFHVVLEEFAGHAQAMTERPAELFVLRAASRAELAKKAADLAPLLDRSPGVRPIDLSALLLRDAGRARGDHRLAVVAASLAELKTRLETAARTLQEGGTFAEPGPIGYAPVGARSPDHAPTGGGLAFLFPGQGSQCLNMLEELALYFPVVREVFEQADQALAGVLAVPLTQVVFPPPAYTPAEEAEQKKALDQTWYAQPALGAADFALFRLFERLGVEPDMVAGHSYGEYVALAAAGALSFGDLMRLSESRGRLVQETQGRDAIGMLAVRAAPEELTPFLADHAGVAVASHNAPRQTVLGGPRAAIDALKPQLDHAGLPCQSLAVSAGFHIAQAGPAAERLAPLLEATAFAAPCRPVFSNRTAAVYPADAAAIPGLLRAHLTEPVRFRDQLEGMYAAGARLFLEVGPGQVLSGLVRQTLGEKPGVRILTCNRRGPQGAFVEFLEVLAQLFVHGVSLRGERLFAGCQLQAIEMSDLGRGEKPPSPTTWLVDGGSARPLHDPKSAVRKVVKPEPARPSAPTAPVALPKSVPVERKEMKPQLPARLTVPSTPAEAGGNRVKGAAEVAALNGQAGHPASVEALNAFQATMRQFLDYQARAQEQRHALMQRFLETQNQVVQAFLTGQAPVALPTLPVLENGRETPASAGRHPPEEPVSTTPREADATHSPVTQPFQSDPAAPAAPVLPPAAEPPAPAGEGLFQKLLALPREELGQKLQDLLLELVAERTGYPVEMLGLDQNMEADLGIDSIKRTEIISGLRDRLALKGEGYETEEFFIKLARFRTLREVLTWLTDEAVTLAASPNGAPSANGAPQQNHAGAAPAPVVDETAAVRLIVQPATAKPLDDERQPARDREILLITEDAAGRARELFALLRGSGFDLAFVRHASATRLVSPGSYEVNLLERAGVEQLRKWIQQHHGRVTSLCHFLPLDAGPGEDASAGLEIRSLFHLTSVFSPDLLQPGAKVIGVTPMGGTFGVGSGPQMFRPGQAAVAGFLKSLAREWRDVHIKVVDIDPATSDSRLLAQIAGELQTTERTAEVGYTDGGRSVLQPVLQPLPRATKPVVHLGEESVVLVLGGARGITATICTEIARRHRCRLILVGRSPVPAEEAEETRELKQPAELKRALGDARRRRGEAVTPRLVEAEYRQLMQSRELRDNLQRLAGLGARFTYHSLDVRDDAALAALVESIYAEHGRLDGVIHGAGVIADGLLVGKAPETFDLVLDTKVRPALTLARTLRPDSLQFLALFSSVVARFGNAGQTDYAAANEVLNKLAWHLDRQWPARVVSIGWGPWDEVGMTNPSLMSREHLARIGFAHMPVREGCAVFLDEIAHGPKGEPEVILFRPAETASPAALLNPALLERQTVGSAS